jgi:hypothetical protein
MWLMVGTRSAGFNCHRRAHGGACGDSDLTHPGADVMSAIGAETCGRARRYQSLQSHKPMPYALFSNDARLSKAYPTEADVWKVARNSGLVVDVATEEEKANPHPVLDNNYEIRSCDPEPNEDLARNKAEAEDDA